jgi:hypothetical protein
MIQGFNATALELLFCWSAIRHDRRSKRKQVPIELNCTLKPLRINTA